MNQILSLIDKINQNIEIIQWDFLKFQNYDYKNKTLVFVNILHPFNDPTSDPKIKIINPIMHIYRNIKEPKISKTSELYDTDRKSSLPSNPNAKYPSVQAIVIKDRNPIGKFKHTSSAKGVVTVLISVEGIFQDYLKHFYSQEVRYRDIREAFISHLNINVLYSISLMVRKGKYNVTIGYPGDSFDRDKLKTEFDLFYDWLSGRIRQFQNEDINKFRDRLLPSNYIKVIFRPSINTDNSDKNHVSSVNKSSTSVIRRVPNNVPSYNTNLTKNFTRPFTTKSQNSKTSSSSSNPKCNNLNNSNTVYNDLKIFLSDKPFNSETQLKLEKYFVEYGYCKSSSVISGIDTELFSFKLTKFLLPYNNILKEKITKFLSKKDLYNPSGKEKHYYYLSKILETVDVNFLLSLIFGRLLRIITNVKFHHPEENHGTNVTNDLAEDLIRNYFYKNYQNDKINKSFDYSFSE